MAYENSDHVVAIDAGTGFVKCVCAHMRVSFPSVYGVRRLTSWEDPKEKTVEAVGYEAVGMSIYPDAVLVRAVLEGRIADELAFVAIAKESIKRLGCEDAVSSLVLVMGLPYGASKQKQYLEKIVERSLRPRRALVIPQSIGTLLSEDAKTGIVMSIGQGTTELVAFDELKPIAGVSIPQACDYLYDDLSYIEHERNVPDRKKIDSLATILANCLAVFKTKLRKEYALYLSGGGALIDGLCESLQSKVPDTLKVALDPVYSNAAGLYKLGTMASSSTGGQQAISPQQ